MADSVFGGGEKPAGDGVFVDANKPATDSGVFSGAESSKPKETESMPAASKVEEPMTDMSTAFGAGGTVKAKSALPWKKILKIGLPILAVLLVGGGILAYFLVQNSDDKIVGDALKNMLRDNEVQVNGEATVSNIGSDSDKVSVKFGVSALSDIEGKNGSMSAELKVRPTISSVDALDGSREFGGTVYGAYVNENIFVKADYLQIVQQVVSAVDPDGEDVEWPEEVTRWNDRWLMVSNDTLTSFAGSDNEDLQVCLQNQVSGLRGNNKAGRELYKILTTIVKFERDGKSGGVVTYKVAPSTTLSDYYNFLLLVRDSDIVRGFVDCADDFQSGLTDDFYEMLDEAIEDYDNMTDTDRTNNQQGLKDALKDFPKITVDISTRTRRFVGITVKGEADSVKIDVKLEINSSYKKDAKIESPSDYLELTESDLNGLGDFDINNILNAGATAAQRGAVDRVADQLKQYAGNNNGNLPTLSIEYDGTVEVDDGFFANYLASDWDSTFALRLLNDNDSKTFPDSYGSMTYSGPFYLQDYTNGGYSTIRYSRYGDSNGDLWVIYGASCTDTLSTVARASGTRRAAVVTYLGDGSYYCADNS
jgi:hypothetical protein